MTVEWYGDFIILPANEPIEKDDPRIEFVSRIIKEKILSSFAPREYYIILEQAVFQPQWQEEIDGVLVVKKASIGWKAQIVLEQ